MRSVLHLVLHVAVPAAIAWIFFRERFVKAWLAMLAGLVVDVDHLFADPVYDPGRCSIGFHPLHRYPVIGVYALLAAWPRLRSFGIGLIVHMALDGIDCAWMSFES
ncbi:MAG: DUF6122 family protein [Gammaproteobacteria bacterium]|nr:DUF6122 family protein [Gammaproteobacteria bacterium]MDH4255053.1 DUF6122 family protein [Gammaproteobacteria bacterium]MDH5310947.1 DUF6122 family protein [Gammaproteobacteria bacterium]